MKNNWERRWHPLLQEWVVISARTADRPWSGSVLNTEADILPSFDENCYLCPGVKRASGEVNPHYMEPFAFNNDFPSFALNAPFTDYKSNFQITEPATGICRVLCFSPLHNLTLAEMAVKDIEKVILLWKDEFETLSANPEIKNILIFENKGKCIGTSNPHPHGQIYATSYIPKNVLLELNSQSDYKKNHNNSLLSDLLENELRLNERIVCYNNHFVAFVPYFARFAFESWIVPRRNVARITDLTKEEILALADIYQRMLVRYDNLFNMSFPNITILYNAPVYKSIKDGDFVFHIEFYPPLRSPDTLKYLAGFETGGGNIINPVMPEDAAARLKAANEIHYKNLKNEII
ncbi:MAG: galactose-1-phosphate uridylyltransferase [Bacteroidales bacterium]|nr:galactose-1-phosphate uridylyltransferase [Bacteroidales bacterium]